MTPAAYGGSPWPLIPSRLLAPVLAVHGRDRQARRAEGAPLSTWTYAGTYNATTADTQLALASAARARDHDDQADNAA